MGCWKTWKDQDTYKGGPDIAGPWEEWGRGRMTWSVKNRLETSTLMPNDLFSFSWTFIQNADHAVASHHTLNKTQPPHCSLQCAMWFRCALFWSHSPALPSPLAQLHLPALFMSNRLQVPSLSCLFNWPEPCFHSGLRRIVTYRVSAVVFWPGSYPPDL